MTKAEIKKSIYLTGDRRQGYRVVNRLEKTADFWCVVPSTRIGNAIVRALRELTYQDHGLTPTT